MKCEVYFDDQLRGILAVEGGRLVAAAPPGRKKPDSFLINLYNPANQTPESFIKSLPYRLRGRTWALLLVGGDFTESFEFSSSATQDASGQWRDSSGRFADPPSGSNPIADHIKSSTAIQSAATKSSRFAAGLAKVKSLPASAMAKLNTQLEQNPTMAEDLGVVAIAMAGQFALMPSADPGTAALLQSSIGVMARSGLQIKKRIVAELKLDPAALKTVSGVMAVSKKLLSDFQRPDVQEKLIGDALGPALGTSANLAAGGGAAGMVAGTIAGVAGTPIAAAKIQQSTRKPS
jgi:hypothetical protein